MQCIAEAYNSFIFLLSAVYNVCFICSFFFTLPHLQSAIYNLIIASSIHSSIHSSCVFSQNHYYQPLWTLVGGGINRLEESVRPTGSLIPGGCTWYKTSIAEFTPEKNLVLTTNGDEVTDLFSFAYELFFTFFLSN